MTLNFFLVGKSHASHFEEAYDYYKKRLLKYAKVNIIALKESKLPDKPSQSQIDKALEEESKTILNSIPKGSFLILMDLQGKELDSFEFSEKFSPFVTLVVGFLLLDEQITVMSVIGAVLITVGVIFAYKTDKPKAE